MSLLSSVAKGKGVQTAFCSLCSIAATPVRALASTARREITDEELQSNRIRGQARLQADALAREQHRRKRLNELVGVVKDVANQGVAENSIMAQRQSEFSVVWCKLNQTKAR